MAVFYPSLEVIGKFKVQPTEGEWALLNFLEKTLDDSYEVFFNPYLNGDRPDVIIMREGNGVMVIEVKDWNLDNFKLDERKKWIYIPKGSVVKSPIDQVLKYKHNLFHLHVDQLLDKGISSYKYFSIVACVVYFHCASQKDAERMIVDPYEEDKGYQTFLKYNIDLFGKDSLEKSTFEEVLIKRRLSKESRPSCLFTKDIYDNFKRILTPSIHLKTQGILNIYKGRQGEIINSEKLEQRVKGVFGSGKTTALVERAVKAYKRALKRTDDPRILILTFNITLKNYIQDKLNRVNEEFPMQNFIIINYHSFINAELNNLGVEMEVPDNYPKEFVGEYLEKNYYSNKSLFESHKADIRKYDAVFIDEIQDYHRSWMDIIKQYFRDEQGDYVLFGDVKQNIYGQPTDQKDVVTNVRGVNELKYCFRSGFKVCDLAKSFQEHIFREKYDIDDFEENEKGFLLNFENDKEGYINYMYLQKSDFYPALYNIVRGNILNRVNNISPNDITILGCTEKRLRLFDSYYRYCSNERTSTMMETIEIMYLLHLKDKTKDRWYQSISNYIGEYLYPKKEKLSDYNLIEVRKRIADLFTIYDLHQKYPNTFTHVLERKCNDCGVSLVDFITFRECYKEQLHTFKEKVYNGDYEIIRKNRKLHFWMNSGTVKISTIHSFKGWESEVIFLIIEPNYNEESFDELLYTGITRARRNLVIINFGNQEYDTKIRPLIKDFK